MTSESGSSSAHTDATTRLGLARFLEEAQVTAQLDHPGIVPVHEVGFDAQGLPFFTMKLFFDLIQYLVNHDYGHPGRGSR